MFIGNNGVWDGFENVIAYSILYFLLFGSAKSVLVFLRERLKGFEVFHGGVVYVVLRYGIKVSGSRLDGNVIGIDGACAGSGYGKENTICNVYVGFGPRWRFV